MEECPEQLLKEILYAFVHEPLEENLIGAMDKFIKESMNEFLKESILKESLDYWNFWKYF